MTTQTAAKTAYRPVLLASTSLFPMLRGPQVFYAPDEEGAEGSAPDPFAEQPGDREPEGDAGGADPEPEPEEPEEGDGDPEPEPEPEGEPEPDGGDADGGEGGPEPEPAKKDWKDRQIAKLREREREKDEALAEATRRAEAAEALLAAPEGERTTALTDAERETIRKEEAAKLETGAYYKRINTGLENMDAAGKKEFATTWDARIEQAKEIFSDQMMARPDFLEAVTDLPNSAAVYHELAGDPDKMEAVLKMPAHKMGMELARLSDKLAKPAVRVSRVPKPITPIDRGGVDRDLESLINDPNASMDEINRRMEAEERKRAKAH